MLSACTCLFGNWNKYMLNIICIMLFIAIYDVLIIFSPGLRSPVQIVVEVLETLFKCRKKLIG